LPMFTTIIIQPIFNLLVLIYALLPGHNFGMAIIIFTIIVRMLMWPLVKKQLHNAKAMRALAPELKKIKAASKGDKKKESALTMELYKERGINPFSSIFILLVQLPIIIGLYSGITKIVKDETQLVTFSYSFIHNLGWMQTITADISKFDDSLFGVINLTRSALGPTGIYWPAMILVASSALMQFLQTRQLMPHDKEARGLRRILADAGKGKAAEQQEVNAAVGRFSLYIIPLFVFMFGLHFAAALPLYWLVSSTVAYIQQAIILREDTEEATALTVTRRTETEAEVIDAGGSKPKPKKKKAKPKPKSGKKRR
jgi:YidC/Oxa1 family membrane protein insertase